MTTTRLPSIALLTGLALVACSDFATAPERQPAEFRMTPDSVRVTEGQTIPFEYTVLDEAGNAYGSIPSWASPLWSYSEASILEVDVEGVGHTIGPGEVRATAQLAGLEAEAIVQVNPTELEVSVPFAYITQSVQNQAAGVPLIAGRDGLLRVYLEGGQPNFFEPAVQATFYRDGAAVHGATLETPGVGIPEDVEEGERALTFEARVPGSVLQPGTSLVLEVDPGGVVPATSSSTLRIPATGELALDIVEVLPFHVRLVPVNLTSTGDDSGFSLDNMMLRTRMTSDVFPLGEIDVDLRVPYTTEGSGLDTRAGWVELLEEIAMLRLDDNSPRYYYGGFDLPSRSYASGIGYVGYPVSIGADNRSSTIAHEIGHNLSLPHAPCSRPGVDITGVDPDYPYLGGLAGQYGWDRTNDRLWDPETTYDLMTYCDPSWISDYNYERVLAYRDTSAFDAEFEDPGAPSRAEQDVLIVAGGVSDGALRLSPALRSTTRPVLPGKDGAYTLEGRDANGAVLFSLSLEPRQLDHGGALFALAIPSEMAQPDRLAALRLTGPEGVVERARATAPSRPAMVLRDGPARSGPPEALWDAGAYPLAVVRDRATGQILAMSRTGRLTLPADPSRVDVVVSDGVGMHRVDLESR